MKEAILEDLQKIGKEGGLKSFEQVCTADAVLVPQVILGSLRVALIMGLNEQFPRNWLWSLHHEPINGHGSDRP